jgi:hypothetical protein
VLPLIAVLVYFGDSAHAYFVRSRSASFLVSWVYGLIPIMVLGILFGILLCLLYVPVVRKLLRYVSGATSWGEALSGFAGIALSPIAFAVPSLAYGGLWRLFAERLPDQGLLVSVAAGFFVAPLILLSPFLLITGITLVGVFLMVLDRVAWPLPNRVLYLIQRSKVMENKKMLWKLGVGLITVAVLPFGLFLQSAGALFGFD